MIDPDNRTEERVSVPLFRYLFGLVVGITCLTFAAGADIPPPCSIAEVSKKVERQTAKWERNAKQYNKLESVLAKIDRALTNNNYSDCDLARVHMARLNVQGMSETYDEAIPALQDVLSSTEPSENPEWSENVVRLSLAFRAQGDFDNLARLTNEYASDVHGLDAAVLERSLFLAKIGLGEPEAA